ncbi:MAG: TrkH family potassium uptake protein [candidate division Zixibacteria bacterium]|nr:TrkH family potassium uptake protein [candidate division Zixibacteria bacterium]
MHKSAIAYAIGKLLQVLGGIMLAPLALAVWDYRHLSRAEILSRPEVLGFVVSVVLSAVIGTFLVKTFKVGRQLQGVKEGFAIVALGWVGLTFWTCLPLFFYFWHQSDIALGNGLLAFTDAYFEIMSGYTTTGATILTDIEALPRSLLLLRSLSHWLGGMGIITLAIVIFPGMGVSAYQMFRGEVPGPSKDRFRPRLAQTVSVLWGVYVLFTAAETLLLWLGPMNLFEAVNHAFATMATGGFSTDNGSVAGFQSDYVEWVISLFMYLAGVNFLLHFRALRGDFRSMLDNSEFRFYNGVLLTAVIVCMIVLLSSGLAPIDQAANSYRVAPMSAEDFVGHYETQSALVGNVYGAFKTSVFQALSIVTTTGFATADFDLWPDFLRVMLVLLMFFGGCAGSTGGGIKMIRIMVVWKVAWTHLRKMTQPRLVAPVKLGGEVIDDEQQVNVVAFFVLFTVLFIVTALLMTLFVPDVTTAVTCSIATIGNIGPGLGGIGAVENYSWIPIPGKWILVLSMLLGRLEIFTVLIVFRPSVWRK